MTSVREGVWLLLCLPLYLAVVACLVLSKYLSGETIDTGPPDHIRH